MKWIHNGFTTFGNTMFTQNNSWLIRGYKCVQNKMLFDFYFFGRYYEFGLKRYSKDMNDYDSVKLFQIAHLYDVYYCDYDDGGIMTSCVPYKSYIGQGYLLVNVYSRLDGSYIGLPADAWFNIQHGMSKMQCVDPDYKGDPTKGHCRSAMLGYCIDDGKWYGSARGRYGFEIGSVVKKGDVAYTPSDIDELYDGLLSYHAEGSLTKVEGEGVMVSDEYNSYREATELEIQGGANPDALVCSNETHTEEYLVELGRGTWIARTEDDAKQMARDYASGCA